MASLWLCLQASGFYPLSILDHAGLYPVRLVASYHLVYNVTLVALALFAAIVPRWLSVFLGRPGVVAILGLVGAWAQGVLAWGTPMLLTPPLIACWVVGVAIFVVGMVLVWSERLCSFALYDALIVVVASFVLAQAVQAVWAAASLLQGTLLSGCAVLSAFAVVTSGRAVVPEVHKATGGLGRALPWGMIVPMLFLVYFCEIFIRLRSITYSGDVLPGKRVVTALIGLAVFAVVGVILVMRRKQDPEQSAILAFSWLVLAYLIALAAMLLFDAQVKSLTNRFLVACSHCVEAFLWMVLIIAVKKNGIGPVRVFALLIMFGLAFPWAFSFDAYYLLGLNIFFAAHDILVAGVAMALIVASAATIGFLLVYALRSADTSHRSGVDHIATPSTGRLEAVLAPFSLTPREHEVAAYLYRGYSAKKTGEMLFLSEASIRAHTMHIYRKMGIHSKQEFISYVDTASLAEDVTRDLVQQMS